MKQRYYIDLVEEYSNVNFYSIHLEGEELSELERFFEKFPIGSEYDEDIDVLIMDPPRSGSDETFLSTVMNKRIKKIVYVSCNPETLARDIQYLSSMYEVNYVQPVDMFPMTAHVETIVGLYRK